MSHAATPIAQEIPRQRMPCRASAFAELNAVWEACRQSNWDGYGAAPSTANVRTAAERLLRLLPLDLHDPSIGAEPDGCLTMEWHRDPRWTFSVSIAGDGLLHYAALFGRNTEHGTVEFFDTVPEAVVRLARKVAEAC